VLGLAIHEFFFVGVPVIAAGLIVAGATRWSGMARLLSLMPWNRCGRPAGGLNAERASHADGLTTSAFLPFRGP
jgi:hypothetical protein